MFLQPQITERMRWYLHEHKRNGDSYWSNERMEESDYEVTESWGYGARLSAPGYSDCTDWEVFDSVKEAADYLLNTYFDNPDDECDEDELAAIEELNAIVDQVKP